MERGIDLHIRPHPIEKDFYVITRVRPSVRYFAFEVGDCYHRSCFSSNQHGKFLDGWKCKVFS